MKKKYLKKCYKCNKVKDVKLFPLSTKTYDGRSAHCISCLRSGVTGYYTEEELAKYKKNKLHRTEAA